MARKPPRDPALDMSVPARRRYRQARARNPTAAAQFDRLPLARRRTILETYERPTPGRRFAFEVTRARAQARFRREVPEARRDPDFDGLNIHDLYSIAKWSRETFRTAAAYQSDPKGVPYTDTYRNPFWYK